MITSEEVVSLLERHVRGIGTEEELQLAIASVLERERIAFVREHRLSALDRPDFMVHKIAIEVKVKGGLSDVTRQLHRYAQHAAVSELVLVTSKIALARVPREMNGKPVHVAGLLGGIV